MRAFGVFLSLVILCLLTTTVVAAQNGAEVIHDDTLVRWWSWDGEGTIAMYASEEDFFCSFPELGDTIFLPWMAVIRPDGSVKYKDSGYFYTRVFSATPDDFVDPCDLWNDEGLLLAHGLSHGTFNDNYDNFGEDPNLRTNVWGWTYNGILYDDTGICTNGIVKLHESRKWMLKKGSEYPACLPDCLKIRKAVGPVLHCAE
jgi:hypothetical protein